MRRSEVFWGTLLVILGVLFFLKAAGILVGEIISWFWPLVIMTVGAWILLDGFGPRRSAVTMSTFSIPLQGAAQASLAVHHGMGRVDLGAGASGDNFLIGTSGVALNHSSRLVGDRLEVSMDVGPSILPFLGPEGGVWACQLRSGLPMSISIEAGASQLNVDLSQLHVTRFEFQGGASSLKLTLPKEVPNCRVQIEAGAASIQVDVPDGVAVSLRTQGVGSMQVNETRFPRVETGVFQSSDFGAAPHRAEIAVDGGAFSFQLA